MTVYYPDLEKVLIHYGCELPYSYSGHGWEKVSCVFSDHDDGNPSATVNLELGRVHCFGCGRSGTGLDVIMDWEKVEIREAIDFAKENFPEAEVGQGDRNRPTRKTGGSRPGRRMPRGRLRDRPRWH